MFKCVFECECLQLAGEEVLAVSRGGSCVESWAVMAAGGMGMKLDIAAHGYVCLESRVACVCLESRVECVCLSEGTSRSVTFIILSASSFFKPHRGGKGTL